MVPALTYLTAFAALTAASPSFLRSAGDMAPYYDSMIAKLIVHGDDRADAIAKCRRALQEYIIEGVATTIPFDLFITGTKEFTEGRYDTGFIERVMKNGSFEKTKENN